jgi:WhiB family redox-sensing transcriptional regulator
MNYRPAVRLPAPRNTCWEWKMHASCRAMPITMFYPPHSLRGSTLATAERQAKLVCKQSRVVARCLQYALDSGEQYGIWGGKSALERIHFAPSHLGVSRQIELTGVMLGCLDHSATIRFAADT